jgi:four helix bundle protein
MQGKPATSFKDLSVWQKSHALALAVYRTTAKLPRTEQYGLTAQMRSAAVSVPANIAEGFRRSSPADKARFLNIAQGSLEELRYYFVLVGDLGYLMAQDLSAEIDEVARLLDSYRRKIVASAP